MNKLNKIFDIFLYISKLKEKVQLINLTSNRTKLNCQLSRYRHFLIYDKYLFTFAIHDFRFLNNNSRAPVILRVNSAVKQT